MSDPDLESELNLRLAARLRALRTERHLSLEALARQSGVSRSMISVIERGESSPTAVVLERLSVGLGVTMADLFDTPTSPEQQAPSPLARRRDQPEWRDPQSGYVRRNVTPASARQPMQIVEVTFPAGAHVAFETGRRDVPVRQQVWLLEGRIDVSHGEEHYALRRGDCLAIELDRPIHFHNPTKQRARYAVVMAAEPAEPRG